MGRSPNVELMLGQRRRRWAKINSTSGQSLTFAGPAAARGAMVHKKVHVYGLVQ